MHRRACASSSRPSCATSSLTATSTSLSAATDAFPNLVVRALVRNPQSEKARALAALPRVELVRATIREAPLEAVCVLLGCPPAPDE